MTQAFHTKKGPFLHDLIPGRQFTGYYLVRHKQLEPFRDASRGQFLTLILSDRSGQMLARVWEGAENVAGRVERGQIVQIQGEVETYLDRPQIRIFKLRPARRDGEYDPRDFLPASERDHAGLLQQLDECIAQIEHPQLQALVKVFFADEEFLQRFSQAPAAQRIHHAYLGGLLEHTLETFTICRTLKQLYPALDSSLLYSAALLHDIGKLRELQWDIDIEYADEGRLIGHVVMSDEMVSSALRELPDFPAELALRLRHILLSHHGRAEWGAPRRPMTLEAIALHHAEELTAQINRFQTLLERRPLGEPWTAYDRLLGRQLYGGAGEDLPGEEPVPGE